MLSSISGKTAISTQLIKELEEKLEKERLVNKLIWTLILIGTRKDWERVEGDEGT